MTCLMQTTCSGNKGCGTRGRSASQPNVGSRCQALLCICLSCAFKHERNGWIDGIGGIFPRRHTRDIKCYKQTVEKNFLRGRIIWYRDRLYEMPGTKLNMPRPVWPDYSAPSSHTHTHWYVYLCIYFFPAVSYSVFQV